jgi:signal transduction histidine kinase
VAPTSATAPQDLEPSRTVPTPRSPSEARERAYVAAGAFALTTFFALLYALRGGIAALDRGEPVVWSQQVVVSLAVWWTCLPLLPFLAWLVRVAPVGRGHLVRNGGVLLAGTFAAAVVRHYALTPVVDWVTGTSDPAASATARTLTYFTTFLVIVGLLHARHYYLGLRRREIEAAEMARSLAEARLAALRAQLHPHFVFNTLNAVASLLHTDPMTADRMLTRFGDLLRFVLAGGVSEEHTLGHEVEVLRKYVELMQLRFGERLEVDWRVDPALLGCRVPWMVLQPLVENALEHGLAERTGAGRLRIAAAADGGALVLAVEDDGAGVGESNGGASFGPPAEGVGLRNTRQRLAHLYGELAHLSVEERKPRGTRAAVRLPLRHAAASEWATA